MVIDSTEVYTALLAIVVIVGTLFSKSPVPTSLLLVITGMFLSLIPGFPHIDIKPDLVLDVFLPLLIYQISVSSSWKDVKKNLRPIALLSVGHVIFIAFLVAFVIHAVIPEMGWPLAFVLGAVVSPPDDVAIVSIAEKIHMPNRVLTILEGEGMLNDATALILFRFALVALVTHTFSPLHAVGAFFMVVIGETLYGLALGYVIGELRLRIRDPLIHMIASILTPFLAYLPAERLGGSGILATVITGFVIGHVYSVRFSPGFRLLSRAVWPTISFGIQSILFLMVGLDMRFIMGNIIVIPAKSLVLYSVVVIATVILGRFFWVFVAVTHLPRLLFPYILKKDPYPPWQYPFVVSWAGMRGAISLAAALAVPSLPLLVDGANPKDLLIFLVFWVIVATLVMQGLTLPWLMGVIGIRQYGQRERYSEHLAELKTRVQLTKAVLLWLNEYKSLVKDNPSLCAEITLRIRDYKMLKKQLRQRLKDHDGAAQHDESDETSELRDATFLSSQIISVERAALIGLWRKEKVTHAIKNKLLDEIDHHAKHVVE